VRSPAETVTPLPDAAPPARPADALARSAAVGARDAQAFRALYDATYERVRRFLLVLARGREELARDAIQETFLRVLKHAHPLPDDAALWRWLFRVARTALIDLLRRERRWQPSAAGAHEALALEAAEGEDEATQARLLAALDRARLRLPDEERTLLDAHYLDGVPQGTLATAGDTTRKAVETRLARIRKRLKVLLLDELRDAP
jgi:RNA polymerase sigma-70 factor (ECF subfamily)